MAEDDPIVSSYSLDDRTLNSGISVFKTKKGGHLGYLGDPRSEQGFHWLDTLLLDWIFKF
jgi:predicted alpha/beta-fold hydrolase